MSVTDYGETLEEYVANLAEKINNGKLGEADFYRLTDKLVEWETNAIRKGLM